MEKITKEKIEERCDAHKQTIIDFWELSQKEIILANEKRAAHKKMTDAGDLVRFIGFDFNF